MSYDIEPELTGRIVIPEDRQYNMARQEFNTFFNKFPLVIVFAQKTQDVVNAVRWALYKNVPIRVRSGGHNYEGVSMIDAGIVIDVSEMNQVEIDSKLKTVTVGPGCQNFILAKKLGIEGLAVPSGVCPTPAIAGITLGGGQGILSRSLGLLLDHVIEIEMVDANGRILHINAHQHSDLFWALRGGGGNFGICTSFRFRTHQIETVSFAEISWNLQDLASVLPIWQGYTVSSADKRFTPTLLISPEANSPLLMQGVFLGSAKELRSLLQPFLQVSKPLKITIKELPFLEAVTLVSAQQPTSPLPFKSVAPYIYSLLPEKGITTIQHFINNPPLHSSVSIYLQGLGGTVAEIPNHATAYFHRKALANMVLFATWSKPEGAAQSIHWVEEFRQAMLPFSNGVYVNTPDLSIKDWSKMYYGSNFDRLTQLKAKYDPKDIFNFPQSIPLA
ncbi:FAD-binding oxidoreductase [Bacillus toyonensis]|uniref:FAD-binding oxidoreductase n=2 Tax=Bacillus cereus group TaxID=86661 RepID=UPI000BF0166B|nr:FAD-binding oxidoreductase [Bacillus toyonensis]PEK85356.1 FAD-dependent oxidase [Bacillus toyonensis]PEO53941.1 FAD-dependent oxidase [Bacillus toyonensis]PFY40151.1 FAD-dependent oxidase [Bacillus toyonensis]PFY43545.1 FAD-dependent oxidase [Bacillus toyonensis]PFY77586.1 FAD-dependent oxidase [Bacillus toyonensis]